MNSERLNELIEDWRDDQLTEESAEELNQILRHSTEARKRFAAESQMHGLLHVAAAEEAVADMAARTTTTRSSATWSKLSVALATIAAIGLLFIAFQFGNQSQTPKFSFDPNIRLAQVRYTEAAELEQANPGSDASENLTVGSRLGRGTYTLKNGFVELDFFGGAIIALQGPAEIELLSQREARLLKGRVTVDAGGPSESFLLHTPVGELLDLGTRYGVYVDDAGVTETHVFEGLVDVRSESPGKPTQRIEANSALKMTPAGQSERLKSSESTFPQPSQLFSGLLRDSGFDIGTQLSVQERGEAGAWQGDVCKVVAEHLSIRPYRGDGMLLFQSTGRSMRVGDNTSATQASQLAQWVDLTPFRSAIADGRVQAKLSAKFNRVAGDEQTDSQFSIELESFAVPIEQAERRRITRHVSRSRTSHQLLSDSNPQSWEKIEAMLTLPIDSQCMHVTILAFENVLNDQDAGQEFDGHFADDLDLQLIVAPGPKHETVE